MKLCHFHKYQNVDFQISMHVVIYLSVFTEGEDGPTYMTDVDNKKNDNDF